MIVPVMAISNLVLTQQIYSEETNGAHAHYREPVPLSTVCLNQFGTAVLVWCGKSVKFDRVCRTFVELNLGSTNGAPSESDVAPASLQSRNFCTAKAWLHGCV